jgi:hypothetical protein
MKGHQRHTVAARRRIGNMFDTEYMIADEGATEAGMEEV